MRLLDTRTGEFFWVDDPRTVRYAILSHVWSTTQGGFEQTYDDIRRFCETALNDGFELGWADSCCIDKSSSTELSESISSMHSWYRYAGVCYAFLQDVDKSAGDHDLEHWEQFRSSKWFTRGWTLQELLAPSVVLFLSNSWDVIGSKHTLASIVSEVTRIDRAVLTFERPLDKVSVARRMSWAAARKTTREEDRAYSLMGIFGVNITVSYGEGRYSFIRLQEEILKHIPDQTIFAW
ncbi:HET-domain-containing protein, partial [Dichomitus squalens LYAD-421 SS1]